MSLNQNKKDLRVGVTELNSLESLEFRYLSKILLNMDRKAANVIAAYANFLNKYGVRVRYFPLYMQIFATNNSYAVDALLDGKIPEKYFEFIEPNKKIPKLIFKVLESNEPHAIYRQTMRVFCGYLARVYETVDFGYSLFQLSIGDVNSLGKNLDETRDQNEDLNRDILDILLYISDMDSHDQQDVEKQDVARKASSIRSDFFDNKRNLSSSIPEALLKKNQSKDNPVVPDYLYID